MHRWVQTGSTGTSRQRFAGWPASLLSALLLMSLVVAAPAVATDRLTAGDRPAAADGEPVRLVAGSGPEPAAADVEAAILAAEQLGEQVEVADRTTEHERHLANPDGTVTYESSVVPQRVRRPAGWLPVDTDLTVVDGRVAPVATVLDLSLSGGGPDELLRLTDGDRWLALSWPQPLPAPVIAGDTATYPQVWPGADLVVRAEPDSFAMALVLRTRQAAQHPLSTRLSWQVATGGLSLRVTDDGAVVAADEVSGEPVFTAPPSLMWDSPAARPPELRDLDRRLGESPPGYAGDQGPGRVLSMPVELTGSQLAVLPDAAMLASDETAYPVWVDPSFSRSVTNWAPVFSSQPGSSWSSGTSQPRDAIRAGNLNWPGCGSWCGRWRSHLRFSISEMSGEQLVGNPTFRVRLTHSASCNATPVGLWRTATIESGVTWNSGNWLTDFGDRSANANKAGGCADSPQPDVNMEWSTSTMRDKLQGAMSAGNLSFTFALRTPNESDAFQWKTFDRASARLIATYNSPPLTPDRLAIDADCYLQCASPAAVRSLRPWLEARVRDPHGAPLRAEFQVRSTSGSVVASGSVNNINSGGTARWRPPSNLSQEVTYRFRVRAHNQHLAGAWSSDFTFTVDTNPPPLPVVASDLYRHKDTQSWNGGVGLAGTFSFEPAGANDVIEYRYRWLDGNETSVSVSAGATGTAWLAPAADMEQVLQVRAIDRAGNISSVRAYAFLVRPQPVDVAYWKFDENQGTAAAPATGGSAYAGDLRGGASWTGSGINPENPAASGNAVALDGSSGYVEMPRVLATNHAAGWSVTAWVYPTALSGWHTVLAQDGLTHSMFRLQYRPIANGGQGGMCVTVQHADSLGSDQTVLCAPAGQVPVERWTHLAAVFDRPAGKLRLWVDGGPNNGETPPGWSGEADAPLPWAANGGFQVGRARTGETGAHGNHWHGYVDEVRAHQRALGEFEIQHAFLQCRYANCPEEPVPTEPVLVGSWDLDEGTGATTGDASGMHNPAGFHGGASWAANGHGGTAAASFDGQSGYLATEEPVLVTDQSYTVAAWARITDMVDWHVVVAQEGTLMSPFRIMYRHGEDGWCFTIRLTDTVGGTLRHACGPRPVLGQWTHLTGVYDAAAGEARLYVNGVLLAVRGDVTSWPAEGRFLIGRTLDIGGVGTGDHFPGQIDSVRAYQSALTGAQVAQLFNGTGP